MAQQSQNPFTNIGLLIPCQRDEDKNCSERCIRGLLIPCQRDAYDQYCQTPKVGWRNIDKVPFRRMVDLWFAGLSFAARKKLEPVKLVKKDTHQFNTGEVFDGNDRWRIQVVMLIAIAVDGNVEVVENPRRMMAIANGLAAAGVPHIVRMLEEEEISVHTPIRRLSSHIVRMLEEEESEPIWNLSDAIGKITEEGA